MTLTRVCLVIPALLLTACGASETPEPVAESVLESASASIADVTLMTLNAQNLFDNIDDPGKDDKAYLPIAAKQTEAHQAECGLIENERWRAECLELDWSDAAIDHKLSVLAAVIRQVDDGRGADIIALQEVENIRILERLRNEHLAELGYGPAILVEGTDIRGIDVAFLSKLPVVGAPTLHPLVIEAFPDRAGDTRGVLEARFELPDGSMLTGYSVHFPAPFHPTAMRVAAYEHLQSLRAALPAEELVFAAGDFNTTSSEDVREKLLDTWVRPDWQVAHDLCAGCPGTYYYAPDDDWSFLDMILVSGGRGKNTTWGIRADSVRIANAVPAQVTENGTPARYRAANREGASDHWPLILTLQATANQ